MACPRQPDAVGSSERAEALFQSHFDLVWRLLRRLGLSPADADDSAQEVFLALARRIGDVLPGKERAFLVGTALNVASSQRRAKARRRESLEPGLDSWSHPGLDPEKLALAHHRLEWLDQALRELDWELRVPFVLFELEQLTISQIASSLGIPMGSVASRLRRARQRFRSVARRLQARYDSGGSP
jgi:RNA polymerase sigma-70 factor (ECF subfamily)